MDIKEIAKRVAEEISDKHKFSTNFMPQKDSVCLHGNGRAYFDLQIEENHGIFAMIIKKAHINVRIERNEGENAEKDGRYWVMVSLSYEHTNGGTNGYTIGDMWLSENYQIVESRI